jgi:hypothetical protein
MKKCEWYKKLYGCTNPKYRTGRLLQTFCPENTTGKCNIKPNSKMVKIKAWAARPWNGKIQSLVWFARHPGYVYSMPVTIIVKECDLRKP